MKIRDGFVSNSSSSSFITGVGIVEDWEKFENWLTHLGTLCIDKWDIPTLVDLDFSNQWGDHAFDKETDDSYIFFAPVNSNPSVRVRKEDITSVLTKSAIPDNIIAKQLLEGRNPGKVVLFNIGNNEGDQAFMNASGSDLDYNINLDHFSTEQREIFNGFSPENGIVFVDKIFGVERNG